MWRYFPDAYDRHGCLKVSVLLVGHDALRHCPPAHRLPGLQPSPKLGSAFAFLQPLAEPWFVAADLPALLVLLAWWQRRPDAKPFWRRTWRQRLRAVDGIARGTDRPSLLNAHGLDILRAYYLTEAERLAVVSLGLNLPFFYYIWRSAR